MYVYHAITKLFIFNDVIDPESYHNYASIYYIYKCQRQVKKEKYILESHVQRVYIETR